MAGYIICITGKSGSGKDTIYHEILARTPGLIPVVPYTTRPKRTGETDGVEYHFVTPERLREMELLHEILEKRRYDTVHGIWYYFTRRFPRDTRRDYLLIITPEGVDALAREYGPEHLLVIYLDPDEKTRLERCKAREETQSHPDYAEMRRRFQADERDFAPERLRGYFDTLPHILRLDTAQDMETCLLAWRNWYGQFSE